VAGEQTIIARSDQDPGALGTRVQWRLSWVNPSAGNYALQGVLLTESPLVFPSATQVVITYVHNNNAVFNTGPNITREITPYFPVDRTVPIFIAIQLRRENVESNRSFTPNGSGQMTVYIGTAESGIIQTSTNFFRGSN